MSKACEILLKLSEDTTIFPTSWELSERYLFVVVINHFLSIFDFVFPDNALKDGLSIRVK